MLSLLRPVLLHYGEFSLHTSNMWELRCWLIAPLAPLFQNLGTYQSKPFSFPTSPYMHVANGYRLHYRSFGIYFRLELWSMWPCETDDLTLRWEGYCRNIFGFFMRPTTLRYWFGISGFLWGRQLWEYWFFISWGEGGYSPCIYLSFLKSRRSSGLKFRHFEVIGWLALVHSSGSQSKDQPRSMPMRWPFQWASQEGGIRRLKRVCRLLISRDRFSASQFRDAEVRCRWDCCSLIGLQKLSSTDCCFRGQLVSL